MKEVKLTKKETSAAWEFRRQYVKEQFDLTEEQLNGLTDDEKQKLMIKYIAVEARYQDN